jgi:hypothetical protein
MNFVTDKLLQLVSIEGFTERLLTYEGSVEERLSPINKPREYLTFEKAVQPLGISGRRFVVLHLHGRVRNIRRASDVAGVYAAAGAGLAIVGGVRAIVLANQKGAVLELSGRQVGLMANADLSGLAITMR